MSALPPLYLLDTNLLIDPRPLISVVTAGELRSLALQFNWQAAKLDQMEFCLGYLKRVSIDDPEIIRAYAVIDAHCQRTGDSDADTA